MHDFSTTAPKEFLAIPQNVATDNDFAMVVDDIMMHASLTSLDRQEGMSETEYAAKLLDEYFQQDHGKRSMDTLKDITYRLSSNFASAMQILTEQIAPAIKRIVERMDAETAEQLEKKYGYVNKNGNYTARAPKFFLLDVDYLYKRYNTTAVDFANRLCSRYHYNVEYLNDTNVAGLIQRITPVNQLSVDKATLQAIYEDVVVQITSNGDDEVVINTSNPDAVKVEGATPNVVKDDQQSDSTAPEPDTSAEGNPTVDDDNTDTTTETQTDDSAANVSVKTDDNNANVTIKINDEEISTEDKELAMQIVKACFDPMAFSQLRNKLFVDKGYVRHTHLLNALKFIKQDITDLIYLSAEEHLPPLEMEMLQQNLEQVRELQMAGVIWLDTNSVQFTETVVIGPNLLNKNLVNRAKRDGIDIIPLIRNYLRAYHNDNQDDLYYNYVGHKDIGQGIRYETILSSAYDVEQALVNAKESTRTKADAILTDARVAAFRLAATDYVRTLANSSTDEELGVSTNDKASFIAYCDAQIDQFCNHMSQNTSCNAEDLLYQLVVGRWYSGTLVEQLYTYLKEGIQMDASSGKPIDASSVMMAKAKAIAELSADYLFKNFVHE